MARLISPRKGKFLELLSATQKTKISLTSRLKHALSQPSLMVKKFIIYFSIIFIVVFLILNSRFVSAQIKFAFFENRNPEIPVVVNEKTKTVALKLPITNSKVYTLKIPAIGVEAPIVMEKSTDVNIILNRLKDGVVHYAGSPLPGDKGASVIFGHSSAYPWYKGSYGSIFALLGRLKIGDMIYIKNGDKTLTYKVTDSLVFHPLSNNARISQIESTDSSTIVLVSCWPVGTDYQRIAVRAELI